MSNNQLLSISEASKSLGVSEGALRQWTDEGKIKAFVTPGGHRRYSEAELKKFLSTHRKLLGIKDLVADLEGTPETHPEIYRAAMTRWYDRLDKESRDELGQQGRRLLGVVIQYVSEPAKREDTLKEARDCGRGFGETLAGCGLTLTDSVEAFISHRDPLIAAATQIMSKKQNVSGRVVEAIPMVVRIMDEALVSLVTTFRERNGERTS